MINWLSVVANGFWLVGLALVLAGFSYYYWLAGQLGQSLGEQLAGRPFQRVAVFGLLLVGIGLALTAEGLWQIIPAAALILMCLFALYALLRRNRSR
ncbi:MAG TPA: hypothetical protein PKE20_02500 [Promineifilum sp.]|nr:hypothetical protein [Promineifilum sp.]